ncbi:MAG TPA: phage holin family protein [Candidatus Limnocylindrales bacterium]|jgi:putative membrane protein|nr:phage holin family protein [Candidatus Limnocylindrales bacterium]
MADIAIRTLINAVALVAAVQLVPGAVFEGEWWQLPVVAAIFGLINAYLRPIVKLLSLPLNLLTFGLVGFAINAGLLMLLALISGQLDLGFFLDGWPAAPLDAEVLVTAVMAALVVSIVSSVLALVRLITPRM